MPGPGQGKRSNKKKWRENTLSANIAAVNVVITTLNIAKTTTSTVLPPSDIATQTAATDTITIIMRRHPSGIAHGKPIITIPCIAAHLPTSAPNLDWDNDPRLSDLSRALQALGWIPPC